MPRLVVAASMTDGRFAARALSDAQADDYKDRLIKYLPAESVAFYACVDKLLMAFYGIDASGSLTGKPADFALVILPWTFLVIGLVGTPIYLYKQALKGQPWILHAAISTVAFLFWAYTLGGSLFILNGWYHILVAAIVAPVFTFIAGWFEPKPV